MVSNKFGPTLRWMAVCATLVGGFEGVSLTAYHDTLASGLPTVCFGETEGVKMGDHYTKQQCVDMLAEKLPRYWHEIEKCIKVEISDDEKIAYTSFSYNLGSAKFCQSTTLRLLNAGDHIGACEGILVYNRTKSKGYVQGLANRREAEDKICQKFGNIPEPKVVDRIIQPVRFIPMPNVSPPTPPVCVMPKPTPDYDKRCDGPARYDAMRDGADCSATPPKTIVHKRHKLTVKEVICTGMFWNRECK